MPAAVPPDEVTGKPPARRLKLTMPSVERQPNDSQGVQAGNTPATTSDAHSSTPPRPSYSPVTPIMTQASLVPAGFSTRPPPEWIDEPEPLPLSLDENPDAIALRAAISILQLQRQNSLKDIRHLDKMKKAAVGNPEDFVNDLKAGKLQKPPPAGIVDVDASDDEMTDDAPHQDDQSRDFGRIPNAQNVVRCPPINWDKYHVVGESLDKLHEQQRRRPGPEDTEYGTTQPDHIIAGPYRPFVDKLEQSVEDRK